MKINVGCGATPTAGWLNFDNSPSVRMAHWPLATRFPVLTRVLGGESRALLASARSSDIRYANATVSIPCPDRSVEVVYSSHMIEHLDREEARAFLAEVLRVLRPGGILRLVAPDLSRLVDQYQATGDANEFVRASHMARARPSGLVPRLHSAVIGPRHHLWMYDGQSLSGLLSDAGFNHVQILPPGTTGIADPGQLDLTEREKESVYVEGTRPA